MTAVTQLSRFDQVRSALEKAASGNPQAFGGMELWSMSRDQMVASSLMGLPLIEVKKPVHSCCKSSATAPDSNGSALLNGLRGQVPFDGSQFPRLTSAGNLHSRILRHS